MSPNPIRCFINLGHDLNYIIEIDYFD
jgi:hypothetical protein